MIVWINCLKAVKYTAYKLTLVYEFVNVNLGERSGLIITELLFDREQKFVNGIKIIHKKLGNEFVLALVFISNFVVILRTLCVNSILIMKLFLLLDNFSGTNCEQEAKCPRDDCAKKFDGGKCNVS